MRKSARQLLRGRPRFQEEVERYLSGRIDLEDVVRRLEPLAYHAVKRSGFPTSEDNMQQARYVLVKALTTYKLESGYQFSTLYFRMVRNELIHLLEKRHLTRWDYNKNDKYQQEILFSALSASEEGEEHDRLVKELPHEEDIWRNLHSVVAITQVIRSLPLDDLQKKILFLNVGVSEDGKLTNPMTWKEIRTHLGIRHTVFHNLVSRIRRSVKAIYPTPEDLAAVLRG